MDLLTISFLISICLLNEEFNRSDQIRDKLCKLSLSMLGLEEVAGGSSLRDNDVRDDWVGDETILLF